MNNQRDRVNDVIVEIGRVELIIQAQIQDFSGGDLIWSIFPENRMKIKKIGPGASKILLCKCATAISFVVTTTRSRENLVLWLSDSFF